MSISKYHVSTNLLDFTALENAPSGTIGTSTVTHLLTLTLKPNTIYTVISNGQGSTGGSAGDNRSIYVNGTSLDNVAFSGHPVTVTTTASGEIKVGFFSERTNAQQYISGDAQVWLVEGSDTTIPYEPYGNSFKDWFYREYGTETETFTSLPQTIIGDGQPVSSYTIKGNTETSGTPSPSNPITINGVGEKTANLSPVNTLTGTASSVRTQFNTAFSDLQFEVDTQYTISLKFTGNYGYNYGIFKVCFTHTDETTAKSGWITTNPDITTVLTSTAGKTVQSVTITDFNNPVDSSEMTYIMLNKGSTALPFEPSGMYKLSILSNQTALNPMYLTEQLMKVDTYSDSVVSSGTVTYNIKKVVFDGTENWTIVEKTSSNRFNISPLITDGNPTAVMVSSHLVFGGFNANDGQDGTISGTSGGTTFRMYIWRSLTLEQFTQWLADQYAAGTPVTVYYVLATPTTESVTAPSITTTGGTAILDVDTTVKPSEFDLTYHGWHEHQPLKRENGQWS